MGKWSTVETLEGLDEKWEIIRKMSEVELDTHYPDISAILKDSSIEVRDFGIHFYWGNGWMCVDNSSNISNFKAYINPSEWNRNENLCTKQILTLAMSLGMERISEEQRLAIDKPYDDKPADSYIMIDGKIGNLCYQHIPGRITYPDYVTFCTMATDSIQKGATLDCDVFGNYLRSKYPDVDLEPFLTEVNAKLVDHVVKRDRYCKVSADGKRVTQLDTSIGVTKKELESYIQQAELILEHTNLSSSISKESVEIISAKLRSFMMPD